MPRKQKKGKRTETNGKDCQPETATQESIEQRSRRLCVSLLLKTIRFLSFAQVCCILLDGFFFKLE